MAFTTPAISRVVSEGAQRRYESCRPEFGRAIQRCGVLACKSGGRALNSSDHIAREIERCLAGTNGLRWRVLRFTQGYGR
jgi:hypothetical protein